MLSLRLLPPCARALQLRTGATSSACRRSSSSSSSSSGIGAGLHGHPLGFAPTSDSGGGAAGFAAPMHATTILSVRRRGRVAVVGDGQVTRGSEVVKPNAIKVRRIGSDGAVISGFAGSTADCLALRERLEAKLEAHPGQLTRACVELAKEWRTEKYLRRLEAVMLIVDKDVSLTVTGIGDVMEPVDGIIAIGSGGSYALAAARALMAATELSAMEIAERSMAVAAEMCVYTNTRFVRDEIVYEEAGAPAAAAGGSSSDGGGAAGSAAPPPAAPVAAAAAALR